MAFFCQSVKVNKGCTLTVLQLSMQIVYTTFMSVWATEMPSYHFDLKMKWPPTDLHLQKSTDKKYQHFSLAHGPRYHPPVLHSTSVPTATTQQGTQMTSQPWEPPSSSLRCHLSVSPASCPAHVLPLFFRSKASGSSFFYWTESLRKNRDIFSQLEWWNTGSDCPKRLWCHHHLWRYIELVGTRPQATWCNFEVGHALG